jgi:hypothetical protein
MKDLIALFIACFLFHACAVKPGAFSSTTMPPAPDYSKNESWAALPTRPDNADRTPDPKLPNLQADAQVDVFFLHPTLFWNKSKDWNGDVGDAKLNQKTDESTILFQASAFNEAGRVYAPRYRQAHYRSFFTADTLSAKQALDLAYADLKAAFEYYLAHYNQGRPIIIAAHSQGALHAIRLLREFFDGKVLKNKLVAAYIVGWPVRKNAFKTIPPCESPDQTGCFCSWRSLRHGHLPKKSPQGDSIFVVNPLTWKTGSELADKSLNEGTVLSKFEKVYPKIADAQIHQGFLWVHKPKFPGSVFFTRKDYHIADYNLFYVNVRKNAVRRVGAFWKR